MGAAPPGASYNVRWSALDNLSGQARPASEEVELDDTRATVPEAAWGPTDDVGDRYAVAALTTFHPDFPHWEQPVIVTLRDRAGDLQVVGIERPRHDLAIRH